MLELQQRLTEFVDKCWAFVEVSEFCGAVDRSEDQLASSCLSTSTFQGGVAFTPITNIHSVFECAELPELS